jgi:DNA-binding MarR family transcriptional regulator
MKYIDRNHIPTDRRPLGYWLRAIEGPLRQNMRDAFATFGVTRREWRALTTLKSGPATLEDIQVALPPRRHGGEAHPRHRTLQQVLDGFVARGWASLDRGSYVLTAEGERIHDAVLTNVQTVRARVTADIPDADYATTMATLQKIATNVGALPREAGPAARPTHGRGRGRMHQRPRV